jgi:NAD(P)-dependent dehydrogenase (short-subunit alcohol dehydrogenase family)
MLFSDKTVVVTGAGSGIGQALAEGFYGDGANVVAIGRTAANLEQTARNCGSRMSFVVGDVANPADVDRLFALAHDRFGKVDILVNNAAMYPKELFLAPSFESWIRTIETNVIGMALCCRAALPGMLQRGFGRVLNVGSFAWRGPIPTASAYSVSKAAVHTLTRSIAAEIDKDRYPDVLVNEFLPGIVRTAMSDTGISPADVYPHAKFLATLAAGSASGEVFVQSTIHRDDGGTLRKLRTVLRRAKRALSGAR